MELDNSLEFLKNSGLQLIACTEKAKEDIYKVNYTIPSAIILGSEKDGISEEYLSMSNTQVKIPMMGETKSLNVSVSAGVILYQAIHQRNNI